jgi:dienelactone hydrolase
MKRGISFWAGMLLWLTAPLDVDTAMAQNDKPDWSRWLEAAPATPEFIPPATLEAWTKARPELRAQLGRLLGQLPARPKIPATKALSREDRGDYFLEKFIFDNGAGASVPGYLLLPKGLAKAPAILYCHQHGGQYEKGGKEELFIKGVPVPEAPGPALVKRGFVVLAIDAYGFGERAGHGPGGPGEKGAKEELSASKFNLWLGRSLWGMIVRDDLMALDYLVSRPEVDAERVGVTGFSMGATRTWWAMALDERFKAGVAVACLTRYRNLIEHEALAAHGIYYFVPNLLNHFDTEAVVALLAPRPVLFMTGDQDGGSPADGIRVIESKVRPIYQLYGRAGDFKNELRPGLGHQYLPEMWEQTLGWLDKIKK